MNRPDKTRKLYIVSFLLCAAVFIVLFMSCICFLGEESGQTMHYRSSYEVNATLASESGIKWNKLNENIETPKQGDKVKIISFSSDTGTCTIVYSLDSGDPVAYASSVPVSCLNYVDKNSHENSSYTIYMKRGLSEAGFFTLLIVIVITLVFLIYNVPTLIRTAREEGSFIKTYTVGTILNFAIFIGSVLIILSIFT